MDEHGRSTRPQAGETRPAAQRAVAPPTLRFVADERTGPGDADARGTTSGVTVMLSALHERHILKLRILIPLLKRVDDLLAAWLDHAVTWEECRRTGLRVPYVPLDAVFRGTEALRARALLGKLRGRLVDAVPVRLLVEAIRSELLRAARSATA